MRGLFKPLQRDEVMTLEEWLQRSSYSAAQKEAILKQRKEVIAICEKIYASKSFGKHESYPIPKALRSINFEELTRAICGPPIASIEKKTIKNRSFPWFQKGCNPRDLPIDLREMLGMLNVLETDFSSMEAHMRGIFAELFSWFVDYMLENAQIPVAVLSLIRRMILGTNVCSFKNVHVELPQTLMSGVVWTSLGNTILNFAILSYLRVRCLYATESPERQAQRIYEFRGRFEGDDGICVDFGHKQERQEIIRKLGIIMDPKEHGNFSEAKFCGVICDAQALKVCTDPHKVLKEMYYFDREYINAKSSTLHHLLRAKALSYKYLFNDCPIVGPLCHKICDMTRGLDIRSRLNDQEWGPMRYARSGMEEEMWKKAPCIQESSRLVVEKRFKIPIARQLQIEREIQDSQDRIVLHVSDLFENLEFEHTVNFLSTTKVCTVPNGTWPPKIQQIFDRGLGKKPPRTFVDTSFKDRGFAVPAGFGL